MCTRHSIKSSLVGGVLTFGALDRQSVVQQASTLLPFLEPMLELSFSSNSVLGRILSGRTASTKAANHHSRSYRNEDRHSRARRRAQTSHASQGSRRDRIEYDFKTPQVSYSSVYLEEDGYDSVPLWSNSSNQNHGTYPDLSCQQCFHDRTYYTGYSGRSPDVSYQQTVPLTVPLPRYDYGISSPGPVPYSQSYGYSPQTPNNSHQSSGFSPQTPNYPRGADYRSRESASSGYRGTGVSEQQPRGRKCIFCGNPGLNLTDEKDGKILHPYLVQRNSEGETVLMGDSLDEAHGVACPAHMSKLMKLWNEACDAQDGFVEFDPGPYFSEYGKWRSYIFASRKAYGKHSFLEVDYEVESAV